MPDNRKDMTTMQPKLLMNSNPMTMQLMASFFPNAITYDFLSDHPLLSSVFDSASFNPKNHTTNSESFDAFCEYIQNVVTSALKYAKTLFDKFSPNFFNDTDIKNFIRKYNSDAEYRQHIVHQTANNLLESFYNDF